MLPPSNTEPSASTSKASGMGSLQFEYECPAQNDRPHSAGQIHTRKRRVPALRSELLRVDSPAVSGVDNRKVRREAGFEAPRTRHPRIDCERDGGTGGQRAKHRSQFEFATVDER